jgi:hypothetical protein
MRADRAAERHLEFLHFRLCKGRVRFGWGRRFRLVCRVVIGIQGVQVPYGP